MDAPSEGKFDMLVIESNLMIFFTFSWVLDSESSAYIYTFMQDLVESRGLREGEMVLHTGNGARVVTVTVGTYPLQLLLDFRLILKDYYYVPVGSKNLISVSMLA